MFALSKISIFEIASCWFLSVVVRHSSVSIYLFIYLLFVCFLLGCMQEEFSFYEVNDPFVQSFITSLDSMLTSFKVRNLHNNIYPQANVYITCKRKIRLEKYLPNPRPFSHTFPFLQKLKHNNASWGEIKRKN